MYVVAIPYWLIGAVAFVWPLRRALRQHRLDVAHGRIAQGLCPACGYDLRATPGRCPECGETETSFGNVKS